MDRQKAKKLITKMSAESAVIVAISPLAVIDMLASDQEKTCLLYTSDAADD